MPEKNICLTGNTLENIQKMSPLLTNEEQYITFGMILAQVMESRKKSNANPIIVKIKEDEGKC